jgi:hypothetical protein
MIATTGPRITVSARKASETAGTPGPQDTDQGRAQGACEYHAEQGPQYRDHHGLDRDHLGDLGIAYPDRSQQSPAPGFIPKIESASVFTVPSTAITIARASSMHRMTWTILTWLAVCRRKSIWFWTLTSGFFLSRLAADFPGSRLEREAAADPAAPGPGTRDSRGTGATRVGPLWVPGIAALSVGFRRQPGDPLASGRNLRPTTQML